MWWFSFNMNPHLCGGSFLLWILICVILNSFIGSFLFSEVSLIKFSSKEVIKVLEIYFKGVKKRLERGAEYFAKAKDWILLCFWLSHQVYFRFKDIIHFFYLERWEKLTSRCMKCSTFLCGKTSPRLSWDLFKPEMNVVRSNLMPKWVVSALFAKTNMTNIYPFCKNLFLKVLAGMMLGFPLSLLFFMDQVRNEHLWGVWSKYQTSTLMLTCLEELSLEKRLLWDTE